MFKPCFSWMVTRRYADESCMVGKFAHVQADSSNFLEFSRIEDVLTELVLGRFAFHIPFLGVGDGFSDEFNLLCAELFALDKVLFFQLQELFYMAAFLLRILIDQFQDAFSTSSNVV
ncbi:hypothetical protein [Akkermansia sp.]|uniref:hypothetical protein n=2 Tax=Akkermansia sp. TaxID=1872421 RepID=UPI002670E6C6|nr:hypothetical protein [Akkermansia sp.]MEE0764412.1 hypothetical protein [Akkermansia sp.]